MIKRKLKYKDANIPYEQITLPSGGNGYIGELSEGILEMKYPGVKEEDILLTKSNYTKDFNTTTFLNSIIISDIKVEDLFVVDVDYLIISAYLLSYGNLVPNYFNGVEYKVDINNFEIIDAKTNNYNEKGYIELNLPLLGVNIEISNLKWGEILEINKLDPDGNNMMTNLYRKAIKTVDEDSNPKEINDLINRLVSRDSRLIRNTLVDSLPRIDTTHKVGEGEDAITNVFPINIDILTREL
jgi:hypothetical protein